MAEVPGESSQPESNNFDNGFEKLDPFSPESTEEQHETNFDPFSPESAAAEPSDLLSEDLVTSTSPMVQGDMEGDMPEEDLYTNNPEQSSEAQPAPFESCFAFDPSQSQEPPPEFEPPGGCFAGPPPIIPESNLVDPTVSSSVEADKPDPSPPLVRLVSDRDWPAPGFPDRNVVEPAERPCCTAGGWVEKLDPRVLDLVYWRDVKKTGVVAGSLFVVLLSLALFSVLSVGAYLSLAALTITISFRVYKNVLGAVQKTGEGHPFKQYLEVDICLPEDKVHHLAEIIMSHCTSCLNELRRLFLVEDIVDSIKFGLFLWVLTYIGSWFNGMTLIILAFVKAFTIPKVYETYKVQIDQYIDLVRTQVRNVVKTVQEKIPMPGKKKSE